MLVAVAAVQREQHARRASGTVDLEVRAELARPLAGGVTGDVGVQQRDEAERSSLSSYQTYGPMNPALRFGPRADAASGVAQIRTAASRR